MANPTTISDLPYHLLDRIMVCLPLEDAARASAMSKQWGSRWLSIPALVFDPKSEVTFSPDIEKIIYRALLHHEGPLFKFSVVLTDHTDHMDIDHWIRHLSLRHQLRCFHLCIKSVNRYIMKSPFFLFRNLRYLILWGCVLSPGPQFNGFSKLVELDLWNVDFVATTIGRVISQCLLLEKVRIGGYIDMDSLEIEGPRLQLFNFHGFVHSIQIKNCPHLADVELCTPSLEDSKFRPCDCISRFTYRPTQGSLHFFPRQLLEYLDAGGLPNRLLGMKSLNLSMSFNSNNDVGLALRFIRRCPNLETLTVGLCRLGTAADVQVHERPDRDNLNQLSKVTLQNFDGDVPPMGLAKYLLASAGSLKEMVIIPAFPTTSSNLVSSFMKQLNESPKASRSAQLHVKWSEL